MKKQTIEEASWEFNPLKKLDGEFIRAAFVAGAEWQKEQSYSYEEVLEILISYAEWSLYGNITYNKWLEQFKK